MYSILIGIDFQMCDLCLVGIVAGGMEEKQKEPLTSLVLPNVKEEEMTLKSPQLLL